MGKPIICVDFDGVIHSYQKGWQDGEIYGNATPGFFRWAKQAMDHFEIHVYSSRSKTAEGLAAMAQAIGKWSIDAIHSGEVPSDTNWGDFFSQLVFASEKPPAFLTIDDRAICFLGNWSNLDPADLLQFRPWTAPPENKAEEFVDDWNRMIGTISFMAAKYDLPAPDLVFHPKWRDHMRLMSRENIQGTLIYMGVRARFGMFEQRDVLKAL